MHIEIVVKVWAGIVPECLLEHGKEYFRQPSAAVSEEQRPEVTADRPNYPDDHLDMIRKGVSQKLASEAICLE